MPHHIRWLLLALVLAAAGCGPAPTTPLQDAARKLKAGMKRADVEQLFSRFRSGGAAGFETRVEDNLSRSGDRALFQTNISRGYRVGYWPTGFFSAYELCDVYFDTNDLIVAYSYLRDHYRGTTNQ
jgi:hypothetical protein